MALATSAANTSQQPAPLNQTLPQSQADWQQVLNQLSTWQSILQQVNTPPTTGEIAAGATPINQAYGPGYVQRYMTASQLADYLANTALVDQTSAFTTAEAVAYVGGGGIIRAPAGSYLLQGTLTLRSGVYLQGDGAGASEYYPTQPPNITNPWATVFSTRLWKTTSGTTGPMFILQTADQINGLYLRYDFIGGSATGVIQIGTSSHSTTTDTTFNIDLEDISLYGPAINSENTPYLQDGTCCAIYFMDGSVANSIQRYLNRARGIRIQNFALGIRLGENCNQNNFTGIVMRQVYRHYELNGGTGQSCVENSFAGINSTNIGGLPTVAITFTSSPTGTSGTISASWTLQSGVYYILFSDSEVRRGTFTKSSTSVTWDTALTGTPTTAATAANTMVFTLLNGAVNNVFAGYSTECNGIAFYLDGTAANNTFTGFANESAAYSYVPPGNTDSNYAQPVNRSQYSSLLLPNIATPQNYVNGQGNKLTFFEQITGTLPQLDSSTTTLAANDASSKSIVQFPSSQYTKTLMPNFRCKFTVYVAAPGGGVGESVCGGEFIYFMTNITTNAGQLSVLTAWNKGAYIKALYFISGKTGGTGMRIAIVCGLYGAVVASHLIVELDMSVLTYTTNSVPMAQLAQLAFVSTACTANDVTDAVSLLTVADTSI